MCDAALVAVDDSRPVEHVGGPNDGEWLPLNENKRRTNGFYVPVNVPLLGCWWHLVTEMRFLPDAES